MRSWSRFIDWLTTPRAQRVAQRKRELQRVCQQCGVSVKTSKWIASRFFNEVAN